MWDRIRGRRAPKPNSGLSITWEQHVTIRTNSDGSGYNAPNPALRVPGRRQAEDLITARARDVPSGPSAPFRPNEEKTVVSDRLPDAPPPLCYIERLQPELLEPILSSLIGLKDSDHAHNRTLIKSWVLVCRRWNAVASRLALINIQTGSPRSTDQIIKYAHMLSNVQGGWTPTRVMRVSHRGEGPVYQLPELIKLFGRTLYTLDIRGNAKTWNGPYVEGNFPPAVEGQAFFPMLPTLNIWEISSRTVQECLRNTDSTKLKEMSLSVARDQSPEEGYLNGRVFPRLENLKLGVLPFGREATLEDLKTATPALKSLKIAASNATLSDLAHHMKETWPEGLKRLDVGVWDLLEIVTSDHPAVQAFVELAKEKELESLDMEVRAGMTSWSLVSMRLEPQAGTTGQRISMGMYSRDSMRRVFYRAWGSKPVTILLFFNANTS